MKNKEELTEFGKELTELFNRHFARVDNIALVDPNEAASIARGLITSCLGITLSETAILALKLDDPEVLNGLPHVFNRGVKAAKKLYEEKKAELDKLNKEG